MFYKFKQLISSRYFSLSFIFVLANLLANLLNYLFHFLVSHTYGPAIYGEIVSLFSHLYILGVPSLIFGTFVIKYIGSGNSHSQQLAKFTKLNSWLNLKSLKFIITLIGLTITFFFVGLHDNLSLTSSLALPAIFLLSLVTAYLSSFLQAFQAFFILSLALIVGTSFKVFGSLIVYFTQPTSLAFIWIFIILGILFQTYILYRYFDHHYLSKLHLSSNSTSITAKTIFKKLSAHQYILMIISLISITAVVNVDVIFAHKTFSAQSSGLYSAWSMLARIIMYAGGPISAVAFVFFADNKHSKNKFKLLLFSSFVNILAGVSLLLLYKYFGKFIVSSLFGLKFLDITPYLLKASLFGLFYSLITNFNNYFISQDSHASLITLFFVFSQLILFFIFGNSLSNLINIQLSLSFTTFILQTIALFTLRVRQ